MARQHDRNWNFESEDDLLYAYMGEQARNTPEDLARIAREKTKYDAPHVADMLSLAPEDIVADLGSGYGHIAAILAPRVRAYHCCDISARMLEKCRASTAGLPNVFHHPIGRADLSPLRGAGCNKIFANSVFIHLHLFDITLYLDRVAELLPRGGLFYFNFQDADALAIRDDPFFFSMRSRYQADPEEITLMFWNSFAAVRGYAQRRGLELRRSSLYRYCATSVTFEKVD